MGFSSMIFQIIFFISPSYKWGRKINAVKKIIMHMKLIVLRSPSMLMFFPLLSMFGFDWIFLIVWGCWFPFWGGREIIPWTAGRSFFFSFNFFVTKKIPDVNKMMQTMPCTTWRILVYKKTKLVEFYCYSKSLPENWRTNCTIYSYLLSGSLSGSFRWNMELKYWF